MSYVFTGRLRTHACGGSLVPVANATLMIYRKQDGEEGGFDVRGHDDVRGREYSLIAQGRTDEHGEFRIDLAEKSVFGYRGSTHPFGGEPFVLDVCARSVDGAALGHDPEPIQFTLGTISPAWQQGEGGHTARWEHDIAEGEWSRVREALDAWTVHGRVLRAGGREPVQGLTVHAYDADLVQDDFLGSATTDAEGRFRIDFGGPTFRQTAIPGAGYERGGPEVYFRVEAADGTVVYREEKSRGKRPDRADASNCFYAELEVENVPSTV